MTASNIFRHSETHCLSGIKRALLTTTTKKVRVSNRAVLYIIVGFVLCSIFLTLSVPFAAVDWNDLPRDEYLASPFYAQHASRFPECSTTYATVNRPGDGEWVKRALKCVLTVGIKTTNRLPFVLRLLETLRSYYPHLNVIVVDDGGVDHKHAVESTFAHTHYILTPHTNIGVGSGRNVAIQHASSEYMLIIDDDFMFTEATRIEVLLQLVAAGTVAVASGAVDDYDMTSDNSTKARPQRQSMMYHVDNATRTFYACPHSRFRDRLRIVNLAPRAPHTRVPAQCYYTHRPRMFFVAKTNLLQKNLYPEGEIHDHYSFFYNFYAQALPVALCDDIEMLHIRNQNFSSEIVMSDGQSVSYGQLRQQMSGKGVKWNWLPMFNLRSGVHGDSNCQPVLTEAVERDITNAMIEKGANYMLMNNGSSISRADSSSSDKSAS